MIEVVYQHKQGEPEPSFFVAVHQNGVDLHFTQDKRPFIATLNTDEVRQLADSLKHYLVTK